MPYFGQYPGFDASGLGYFDGDWLRRFDAFVSDGDGMKRGDEGG